MFSCAQAVTEKYYLIEGQCRRTQLPGCNSNGFVNQQECETACGSSARQERELEEQKLLKELAEYEAKQKLISQGDLPSLCGLEESKLARQKRAEEHKKLVQEGKVPSNLPAVCNIRGGATFHKEQQTTTTLLKESADVFDWLI